MYRCGCNGHAGWGLLHRGSLTDLNIIEQLYSFELIGVLILAIALSRTVIVKYISDIDTLEYLGFAAIYLYALLNYYNEIDGMVFVAFIVAVLFFSYYKKYGNIFVISLLAILVNALLLTRKFWLLIPWWIYLLVIGSVLIMFAVRNESNENNELVNLNLQAMLAPRIEACRQLNELFGLTGTDKEISVRVRSDLENIIKKEQSIVSDYMDNGRIDNEENIKDEVTQDVK